MAHEIVLRINIDNVLNNAEEIEHREIQRRFNIMQLLSKISMNTELQELFDTEARSSMEHIRYGDETGVIVKITIGIPLLRDVNSLLALTPEGVEYIDYSSSKNNIASQRLLVIDPKRISKGDRIGSALESFHEDLLFDEGMLLSGSEQEIAASMQTHLNTFADKLRSSQASEQ